MDAVRSSYEVPDADTVRSKSQERKGVMSRTMSKMTEAMQDTATSALDSVRDLTARTVSKRSEVDIEEEAKLSAALVAQEREAAGISISLIPTVDTDDVSPNLQFINPEKVRDAILGDKRELGSSEGYGPSKGLMVRPKARPESLKGLSDDDMGLPDDDNYMGVIEDTPEQNLLDRIAFGEGADPKKLKMQSKHNIGTTAYHMVYNYGNTVAPPKPITEMTLSEIEDYQKDLIKATKGTLPGTTKGTSAVGKYQVLRVSLFGEGGSAAEPKENSWAGKLGLTADTIYTPAVQEAIGRLALKETGYDNWKKGKKSESAMLLRVADIWASVEGSTAGQGTHTTKKDLEPFLSLVRPSSPQAVKRSLRPQARPTTKVASN